MTKRRSEPTVGGQPASAIYHIIEATPKRALADGMVFLGPIHLCAQHGRYWQGAYDHVERQLMVEMEACPDREDHATMLPHQWRALVIHAMADEARRKLGIRTPHPLWC
jgi:hypothetical protein